MKTIGRTRARMLRLARAIHAVTSTFTRATEYQHLEPADQERYIEAAKVVSAHLDGKVLYHRTCVSCGDGYGSKCMDSKRCQSCRTLGRRK